MKVIAIVQARMSSNRLPGKVLSIVNGKPMLDYVLERVKCSALVKDTIVATSTSPTDDPVASHCATKSQLVFRGSLEDVAKRFLDLFAEHRADGYVRISGDSPMIDSSIIDQVVALYVERKPDLATNVFPRSFPKGQSVEVINPEALRKAYSMFTEQADNEHVTRFFYRRPGNFIIANLAAPGSYAERDLCIDNFCQLEDFRRLVLLMDKEHRQYGWKDILSMQDLIISDARRVW